MSNECGHIDSFNIKHQCVAGSMRKIGQILNTTCSMPGMMLVLQLWWWSRSSESLSLEEIVRNCENCENSEKLEKVNKERRKMGKKKRKAGKEERRKKGLVV